MPGTLSRSTAITSFSPDIILSFSFCLHISSSRQSHYGPIASWSRETIDPSYSLWHWSGRPSNVTQPSMLSAQQWMPPSHSTPGLTTPTPPVTPPIEHVHIQVCGGLPLCCVSWTLLSLPDNVRALWTQIGHLQQIIKGCDRHIHSIELQFNNVLQALAALQLSHQTLQDTVHHGHQDINEEVTALWSQLNVPQEQPPITAPTLIITPSPGNPIPSVTSTQTPITSNTPEPNLKPAKPEAWNRTECDAKPFRNRVLNYLGSFSGTLLSKQVVFILSLTTHAKFQLWTNTRQDWLANNPTHLLPTIMMLLDDFMQWHKSHAAGCPWVTDMMALTLTATLEEVKEDEMDFLNGGL